MPELTFLRCRDTGHVQFATNGYAIWSPCAACGWDNNQVRPLEDHWEVIHETHSKKAYNALFRGDFSAYVDSRIQHYQSESAQESK